MPIKEKNLKKCHSDARLTIDVIHKQKVNEFKINEQKKKIYTEKLQELSDKGPFDENVLYYKQKLSELYYECLSNKNDEDMYYLDNGLLLNDYYNEVYHIKKNSEHLNDNQIMNWFSQNKKPVEKTTDIVSKYLSTINDKHVDFNISDNLNTIDVCEKCKKATMIFKLNESEMYCQACGYTEDILIHTDKSSFKDAPREISYFAYKRINHFNEWIAQIQAKETTAINPDIYKRVIQEIKKNKSINQNDITHIQVREILKKINCNKYYEHIPHIINIITKNKKRIIFGDYEDRLRNMFKEIQIPFMKNCPEQRKNFLSYSYVLHKFCQLLELDHLLEFFPLLKSREKLKQQDDIWKNICHDLKWQYIPSI
jgi:hypothetical protein